MSTRTSISFVESDGVTIHLYREMHDGAVHLEVETVPDSHSFINVVVPEPLVEGIAAALDSCWVCGKRHRFGEGGHIEAGVMGYATRSMAAE